MTKIDRAEAYYLVARELEEQAQWLFRMAKDIAAIGDRISEENMRDKPPPTAPAKRGRKPKVDKADLGQEWPGSENTSDVKP